MIDLLCVGETVVDFLPGPEEGTYLRKAGGAPANVAVAAARNGVRTAMLSAVGDDDFGRYLAGLLRENNVCTRCVRFVREAITTMTFVSLDAKGERSFTFARKPGADTFLNRNDVDRADLDHVVMVHGGSCSLSRPPASDATAYALSEAKKRGKMISFDVNYRSALWDGNGEKCRKEVLRLLPLVDFLKLSEEEEALLEIPCEEIGEKFGVSAVVKTLGERGAVCVWQKKRIAEPGRKAVCVDATGAGDAFWGGFLSFLLNAGLQSASELREETLRTALRYGNVAGGLCVQKKGAMEALPTRKEISEILEAEA